MFSQHICPFTIQSTHVHYTPVSVELELLEQRFLFPLHIQSGRDSGFWCLLRKTGDSQGMVDTMRSWSTESTEEDAPGLTETEAESMGTECVCVMASVYMLWLSAWSSCKIPKVRVSVSLTLLPALETPFLQLTCLVQP